MDAAAWACAPPTLSQDMYDGCKRVSRRVLGVYAEFPGQRYSGLCTARAV